MDERLEEKIDRIEGYISLLNRIHSQGKKTAVVREAKENLMRKIVQTGIDIASRLISLNKFRRPDSYAEYFEALRENEVISRHLCESLMEMARFRNLITHQYHKIELEELDEIIEEDLDDIKDFIAEVTSYSD